MQQRPAQQPMTQSAAEAERSGTFAVALPPGVSAGMRLAVAVPQGLPNAGATCEFDVPQGLKAGDIVQVPLPPEGYQPGQGAAQQQSQQPPAAAAPAQDKVRCAVRLQELSLSLSRARARTRDPPLRPSPLRRRGQP